MPVVNVRQYQTMLRSAVVQMYTAAMLRMIAALLKAGARFVNGDSRRAIRWGVSLLC